MGLWGWQQADIPSRLAPAGTEHSGVPGRPPSPPTHQGAAGQSTALQTAPPASQSGRAAPITQGGGKAALNLENKAGGKGGSSLASPHELVQGTKPGVLPASLGLDSAASGTGDFPRGSGSSVGRAKSCWEPRTSQARASAFLRPLLHEGFSGGTGPHLIPLQTEPPANCQCAFGFHPWQVV